MPRALTGLVGLLLLASPLAAQDVTVRRPSPPVLKYGKWVVLAASAGLNLAAARAHDRAQDSFRALQDRCVVDATRCRVGQDGTYLDPASESLYQASLTDDRRAGRFLVAGQATLLGAGAMFVLELLRPKGLPPNKPFQPEVTHDWRTGTTYAGLRVAF